MSPIQYMEDFNCFQKSAEQQHIQHFTKIKNGTPKLIGNTNKRLPPAAVNYPIT